MCGFVTAPAHLCPSLFFLTPDLFCSTHCPAAVASNHEKKKKKDKEAGDNIPPHKNPSTDYTASCILCGPASCLLRGGWKHRRFPNLQQRRE